MASGEDAAYADAVAGSALAGMQNVPVLLTHPTEVAKSTQDAINELKTKEVVVLGGPAAVSDAVAQQLGASERLAGANR
ncbi:cell wall-binding repeat-containing protein [Kytococcus sedentarius]|uniref:cell wall-binding repeat-containing protein n=1 Tax=Kytococcus sedentarius TaxID=1276 RepID=UPI003879A6B0